MYFFNIIALIISLFFTPPGDVCPPREYPWFNTTFIVEPPPLPAGITISQPPQFFNAWTISNTTDVPLYLFKRSDEAVWTSTNSDADVAVPNYDSAYKLVNNRLFFWNSSEHVWQEYTSGGKQSSNLIIGLSDDDREQLFAPLYQNVNLPTSERRPDGVHVPQPQTTYILLSYNGEFIPVPVTMRYSLDPHHQEFVDRARSCGSGMWLLPLIMIVWTNPFCALVLVLAIVTGVLAWFSRVNRY